MELRLCCYRDSGTMVTRRTVRSERWLNKEQHNGQKGRETFNLLMFTSFHQALSFYQMNFNRQTFNKEVKVNFINYELLSCCFISDKNSTIDVLNKTRILLILTDFLGVFITFLPPSFIGYFQHATSAAGPLRQSPPQCVVVFCRWELSHAMLLCPGPKPFPIVCCHMDASTNMKIKPVVMLFPDLLRHPAGTKRRNNYYPNY